MINKLIDYIVLIVPPMIFAVSMEHILKDQTPGLWGVVATLNAITMILSAIIYCRRK